MSDRRFGARFIALAVAAGTALSLALLFAGCAQEGKLIQAPLRVHGVAVESELLGITATTGDTDTVRVRLKMDLASANPCETGHVLFELALRTEHPSPGVDVLVHEITPVARYNADDKCVLEPPVAVDTVQVLYIKPVLVGFRAHGPVVGSQLFRVTSAGTEPISFQYDTTGLIAPVPNTARFDVWVQTVAGGSVVPVSGATVTIDTLGAGGVATTVGSGTSGGNGLFSLDLPCGGVPDTPGPAYRVTVTSGASTEVFSAPSFPARCGRREQVYIRI